MEFIKKYIIWILAGLILVVCAFCTISCFIVGKFIDDSCNKDISIKNEYISPNKDLKAVHYSTSCSVLANVEEKVSILGIDETVPYNANTLKVSFSYYRIKNLEWKDNKTLKITYTYVDDPIGDPFMISYIKGVAVEYVME